MLRPVPLTSVLVAALALSLPLGCGGKKDDEKQQEEVKVIPQHANGSPVAVEFIEFTGEGERGLKLRLYNHGDKTAVAMHLLFRYYDANDQLLKVKVGTPFESDTAFTSVSGRPYKCEPGKNATIEIEGGFIDAPAEAVRAEIVASSVRSLAADGNTIEDWWEQENWSEWPSA